jgi:hypothetical protein
MVRHVFILTVEWTAAATKVLDDWTDSNPRSKNTEQWSEDE